MIYVLYTLLANLIPGAGVPKPPKNRFLKAREAQNAGFGTGQQHGQQQGQEFQNHQKIAFLKAREAQNAGFGTGQQHGQQQGQEFQNHQKIAF